MTATVFTLRPPGPEPEDDTTSGPVAGGGSPSQFPGLPEEFWSSRDVLTHIRNAARSRVEVPDVVFHSCLARISGIKPHTMVADSGISGDAVLNYFTMPTGASGGGKTGGVAVARSLIPAPTDLDMLDDAPMGSGEGIAEAFMGEAPTFIEGTDSRRGKWVDVKKQVRHNAVVYADEGEFLTRTMERSGATIGAMLRSAWTGVTIGQLNATKERTRIVKGGSYSLGVIVGMQPSFAAALVADSHAGLPQRFMLCTAADPGIPETRIPWPGDLPWDANTIRPYGRDRVDPWGNPVSSAREVIEFPDEIKNELFRKAVARRRGTLVLAELDGQSPLMLVKLASLLALLDSRKHVIVEDWDLARMVWDNHCQIRDLLLARAGVQAEQDDDERVQRFVDREVRVEVAKASIPLDIERLGRLLHRHVVEERDGLTRKLLREKLHKRDRHLLDQGIASAVDHGWIMLGGEGYVPASPV